MAECQVYAFVREANSQRVDCIYDQLYCSLALHNIDKKYFKYPKYANPVFFHAGLLKKVFLLILPEGIDIPFSAGSRRLTSFVLERGAAAVMQLE
jgi:hypothetical protein